jgi:putative CocE/NonD family hydrolase
MIHSPFLPAAVKVRYNLKIPMRDGVHLSADIYHPQEENIPRPVVLLRTPYDNTTENLVDEGVFYAQHGYVYVAQDVRGRHDSDGVFYPWINEFNDGHDTIEWIGAQSWCDGNIGMVGSSYAGNVQWQAAVGGSSYLKTIIPRVIGHNLNEAPHYQGGAFQLGWTATWMYSTDGRTRQKIDRHNWPQIFGTLPLKDLDGRGGKEIAYLHDWIAHPDYDSYWKALAIEDRYGDVKVPVFNIGGWYDFFSIGTPLNFVGMREIGGSELARRHQKLLMGPWIHSASKFSHAGEVDFGGDSLLDLRAIELRWMDFWLKGLSNGVQEEAPLRIFVMGTNQWRDEREWPLARTRNTPFYLHSNGSANSLQGDGSLLAEMPDSEPADQYVYDPAFPTPTRGGCNCCNPEIVPYGAYDQRSVEHRSDVLVYTSQPLEEDLEVTGPVTAILYASTTARDTDFTAKLVDVDHSGYAMNLCDGIIRGRYRKTRERQELLDPETVYEFTLDLGPTSNVFLKGHRIRVDISSSNFPRFDRNLNTGNKFGEDVEMQVAHQQVFHDQSYPSHILLPVIPKG